MLGATFCLRKPAAEPKKPSSLFPDRDTRSRFESFSAHNRYSGKRGTRPRNGRKRGHAVRGAW
jgi:hypothetical protein